MKLTTNTFTKKLTFWGPPQAFFLRYLSWISIPFLVFSKVSKPRFCQNTPKIFSPAAGFFGYLRSGMQRFSNPLQQLLFLQIRFQNTDALIQKPYHNYQKKPAELGRPKALAEIYSATCRLNVWKFSVISLPDRHAESGDSDVKLFELDWNLSFSNVSEPQIVFQNAAGCSQVVRERSEVFLLIQI